MTSEEAIKELEILKEDYWEDDGYGHKTKQYDNTMLALDMAIKALEQEPRKGYWLRRPHVYGVTYCSICDFELKIDNTNYCPNCGVKMESEVDNGNDD